MIKFDDLVILAPGGACGSFVSTIFGYYLGRLSNMEETLNIETGDCHSSSCRMITSHWPAIGLRRKHQPGDTKILICIRPAQSHAYLIVKMMYYKHFKGWIKNHPNLAILQWPELQGHLDDPYEVFMSNISSKICIENWCAIDQSKVDLLIEFDDVFTVGKNDLNEIISSFLNVPKLPEVDTFINQYRTANQQYI